MVAHSLLPSQWERTQFRDRCRLLWPLRESTGTLLLLVVFLCLFTVVLLILLDQELLGGPPELPALHLALCGLHHDGGQAVLELAATVEVRRVGEDLKEKQRESPVTCSTGKEKPSSLHLHVEN